jgi:hypothetical protein
MQRNIASSETMTVHRRALLAFALLAAAAAAQAQVKWDLPAAYPATNFHTEST